MQELLLGIDICDDYSQISYYDSKTGEAENIGLGDEESSCMIPTVICKEKGKESWLIGEEAYRCALFGKGTLVDKLVKLVSKEGTATIEGVKYTAQELLRIYFKELLKIPDRKFPNMKIGSLYVTFQKKDVKIMDPIRQVTEELGIRSGNVRLANHSEAYLFYVLSQDKELWTNQVAMFDLSENGLHYYELGVTRGRNPQMVEVYHEELEEGFSLEILETNAGKKLGDTILTSCAERLLKRKVVSSVLLTGKGFEDCNWAPGFIRMLCGSRRRVFSGLGMFSKGAAVMAKDATREETEFPYICLCEGRLPFSVTMNVMHEGKERELVLAPLGSDWYEKTAEASFILDRTNTLDINVNPISGGRRNRIRVPLDELPARPNKTTKILMRMTFLEESKVQIRVEDLGFGEFFPAGGQVIQDIYEL